MSKKTILVVVALVVIALGAWVYFSLKTAPATEGTEKKSLFSSLFPFGSNKTPQENPAETPGAGTGTPTTTIPAGDTRKLRKISEKFIAGFTVLPPDTTPVVPVYDASTPTEAPRASSLRAPVARLAERGDGFVFDVDALGENEKKVSGTIISGTVQALFADSGKTLLYRYIRTDGKTIATYLGRIVPASGNTGEGTTTGDFLPDNILDATISPDKKSIFVLLSSGTGVTGITMKSDGTAKKQLFVSAFTEWLSEWTKTGISLTTKASAYTPGYAYTVNASGVLKKIIGQVNGLTTKISPDGKTMLYSVSSGNSVSLHIRHLGDGSDINTGLSTLPEKCIWAASANLAYCGAPETNTAAAYPDAWYQGTMHFTDTVWSIDTTKGTTNKLTDGEGNTLDIMSLTLDQNETYLFFVNKHDGSLWSFNLAKS